MIRTSRLVLALALLGLAAPPAVRPLHAQLAATASVAPTSGPRYENLRAGYSAQDGSTSQLQLNAAAKGPFGSKKNGQIAAIVGGAAMVGGLIIGDDAGAVIAVTGLVIGVLGLWTWLASS
jgi:hypothetical protein